jgi:hypothetical protein
MRREREGGGEEYRETEEVRGIFFHVKKLLQLSCGLEVHDGFGLRLECSPKVYIFLHQSYLALICCGCARTSYVVTTSQRGHFERRNGIQPCRKTKIQFKM